jgi:predicted kinase
MATLHILCGLPCTGKTTLALRLERELPALRLCPDEWMSRIVGDGYDAARRKAVNAVQLDLAIQVLRLGSDVVLESGFWWRAEREDARSKARSAGAETQLHFLDAPLAELQRRVVARNAVLPPDTFAVTPEDLAAWYDRIERPDPAELD